ncbi:uncharacterized protein BYT42DRAFT_551990 [Radiomyces spectabilis]|uniref:uncharacterized protein n=1 Tax=Radiomyces spectabilis TaxID=64574 RepID=UPI00221EDE5A|nr:uncharacterized protein BYT42DRAFT_551990 [Radiomyces spectabilis]KAI8393714.1 hypothetical protein BYT42DRAFT_551990 [Radiomyces spectabilis]
MERLRRRRGLRKSKEILSDSSVSDDSGPWTNDSSNRSKTFVQTASSDTVESAPKNTRDFTTAEIDLILETLNEHAVEWLRHGTDHIISQYLADKIPHEPHLIRWKIKTLASLSVMLKDKNISQVQPLVTAGPADANLLSCNNLDLQSTVLRRLVSSEAAHLLENEARNPFTSPVKDNSRSLRPMLMKLLDVASELNWMEKMRQDTYTCDIAEICFREIMWRYENTPVNQRSGREWRWYRDIRQYVQDYENDKFQITYNLETTKQTHNELVQFLQRAGMGERNPVGKGSYTQLERHLIGNTTTRFNTGNSSTRGKIDRGRSFALNVPFLESSIASSSKNTKQSSQADHLNTPTNDEKAKYIYFPISHKTRDRVIALPKDFANTDKYRSSSIRHRRRIEPEQVIRVPPKYIAKHEKELLSDWIDSAERFLFESVQSYYEEWATINAFIAEENQRLEFHRRKKQKTVDTSF